MASMPDRFAQAAHEEGVSLELLGTDGKSVPGSLFY